MGGGATKQMLRLILASAISFVMNTGLALADCAEDHVHLLGSWGAAQFAVELADSDAKRAQGLMHRDSMERFSGMLFVYDAPQKVAFWMKDTLISLDILYFTGQGQLLDLHENAVPGDLTPLRSSGAVQYVLEINAGLAKALKLRSDTVLMHPSLTQDEKTLTCE